VLRSVAGIIEEARRQDPYLLWRYSLHFLCSGAELCLVRGSRARALDLADRCSRAAEESNSRKYMAKARSLRGRILATEGRTAEAHDELSHALELARQLGDPLELGRTLDALGSVHEALARPDEARAAREEALEVLRSVADALSNPVLRETVLRAHAYR
jgi:tetratricopeptide (TPR) repeat protein